jgi:hypothetical protein
VARVAAVGPATPTLPTCCGVLGDGGAQIKPGLTHELQQQGTGRGGAMR